MPLCRYRLALRYFCDALVEGEFYTYFISGSDSILRLFMYYYYYF